MTTVEPKYNAAAILCGLIAALAIGQAGCARGREGPSQQGTGAGRSAAEAESSGSRELQDPLLRRFDDVLEPADDLDPSDKSRARRILEEADPILTRVKEENRKALERANRPPRRGTPKRDKNQQPPDDP